MVTKHCFVGYAKSYLGCLAVSGSGQLSTVERENNFQVYQDILQAVC